LIRAWSLFLFGIGAFLLAFVLAFVKLPNSCRNLSSAFLVLVRADSKLVALPVNLMACSSAPCRVWSSSANASIRRRTRLHDFTLHRQAVPATVVPLLPPFAEPLQLSGVGDANLHRARVESQVQPLESRPRVRI